MIKVRLVPSENIKVRLKPAQGIKVGLKTTYLFDNTLIDDEVALAKDWAIKDTGKVIEEDEEIDYSSKAWAVGGTGTETNNSKYYAEQAAISETNAGTSETNAAASALAASQDAGVASTKAGQAATSESNALSYSQSAASSANDASHEAAAAYDSQVIATDAATTAATQAGIATTKAGEAAASALQAANSAIWAEGTDVQVAAIGGEHSSKGWAGVAKALVDSIGSVLHYKGSVATRADLPTTDQELGDMYNIIADGSNCVWDGTDWDEISGIVDLSAYRTAADQDVIDSGKQPAGNYVTTDTAQDITAKKTFVSSAWNGALSIKRDSTTNGGFIVFENNNGIVGGLGINGNGLPLCPNSSGLSTPLVRSGNINNPSEGNSSTPVYINSNGIATACSSSIPTQPSDIGAQPAGDYVTIAGTETITGDKTFTEPVTIQNGQGTGCLLVGANVNSSTLSNNQRKLARINAPAFGDVTLGATLIGWDTSGDNSSPVTNNAYDSVCFGGMKKITNCTSPMSITFCVTDTRQATAATNKKYALAMDANTAIFGVQPKYNGYNLATINDLPTVNDATITITQGGVTKGSFTLNQSSGETIALDAGGGSVDIDGVSITKNSDDELQTVGVIDQNNTSNALKQWSGTKAQYDALVSGGTVDSNTIYNITDDSTSAIVDILSITYPVGSVYIGTMATCPLASLFGTWSLIGTKILTDNPSSVPVKGNGKALGLNDGSINSGILFGTVSNNTAVRPNAAAYGSTAGTQQTIAGLSRYGYSVGVTKDSAKSGIVADMSSVSNIVVNIWERTA